MSPFHSFTDVNINIPLQEPQVKSIIYLAVKATQQIIQHLSASMNLSKKDIVIGNFLGGFAWGAGTILGAIIIGAILFYILKPLGVFDIVVKPSQELNPLRAPSQQLR